MVEQEFLYVLGTSLMDEVQFLIYIQLDYAIDI